MKKNLKAIFSILVILSWFILAAFFISLAACSTSPELKGDLPVNADTLEVVEAESVPISDPVLIINPDRPAPCYPSSVRFSNGYGEAVIPSFAWGVTYQVQVRNFSRTCSFECCFAWSVFDGDTMLRTGRCCPFNMAPGESKTVNARVPWPWLNPPPCNLAVLKVRAE